MGRGPRGNGDCFGLAIDCPLWRRNLCCLECVSRCPLLIGSVLKRDTRSSWLSWLLGMFVSDTDTKCIWKMWQVHIFWQTQKLIIHKNLLFLLDLWHLKYKYKKCFMLQSLFINSANLGIDAYLQSMRSTIIIFKGFENIN